MRSATRKPRRRRERGDPSLGVARESATTSNCAAMRPPVYSAPPPPSTTNGGFGRQCRPACAMRRGAHDGLAPDGASGKAVSTRRIVQRGCFRVATAEDDGQKLSWCPETTTFGTVSDLNRLSLSEFRCHRSSMTRPRGGPLCARPDEIASLNDDVCDQVGRRTRCSPPRRSTFSARATRARASACGGARLPDGAGDRAGGQAHEEQQRARPSGASTGSSPRSPR